MFDETTDFGDSYHDYNNNKTRKTNLISFIIENDEINICSIPPSARSAVGLNHSKDSEQNKAIMNKWFIDTIQSLEGKQVSLLVENTTIKDQKSDKIGYWRFRLDPRHPLFDKYSFGGYSLTFECVRRNGRLKIIKAFLDTLSRRPYEMEGILEGNFQLIRDSNNNDNGTYLSQDDFDWLLKLPKRQKDLEIRLKDWEDYLSEHKNAVKNKIGWVAYKSLRRVSPTQAEINISTKKFSSNANKSFFPEEEVQILGIEIPENNQWRPDEDVKEPTRIGSISRESKLKGIFESDNSSHTKGGKNGEWFSIRIDLIDSLIIPEPEDISGSKREKNTRRDPLERLPSEGLLVNSVFYDELPLILQQKAISRLKEKKAANPRLEDFIFNIREANNPIRDEDIDETSLVEKKLNFNQINALRKGLNAPDICLIQGPPGTGKTTVIAELCNQITLRNGSVLIASQSNLAVDNALCRIANLKHIRPIRLGARTTEEGNDFLADNVVQRWFQGVKDKLSENVLRQKSIQEDLEAFAADISLMEQEHNQYVLNCQKYKCLDKQAKQLNSDLESTNAELEENKKQLGQIDRNLCILEKIIARSGLIDPTQIPIIQQHYPEIYTVLREKIAGISLQKDSSNKVSNETSDFIDLYAKLYNINTNRQQLLSLFNQLLEILSQQNLEGKQKEMELVRKRESIFSEMQCTTTDEAMRTLSADMISVNKEIDELKKIGDRQLTVEWQHQLTGYSYLLDCYCDCAFHLNLLKSDEINLFSEIKSSLAPDILYKDIIQILLEFTQGIYDDLFGVDKMVVSLIQRKNEELLTSKNRFNEISLELQKKSAKQNKESQKLESDLNETMKKRDENKNQIIRLFQKIKKYQVTYNQNLSDTNVDIESEIEKDFTAFFNAYILKRRADLESLRERYKSVLEKTKRWHKLQIELIKKIDNSSHADYDSIKDTYIAFANVVGATCTETGKWHFWNGREFDLVIIDEVSKATPPELLMPMLLGKQIVLVGDHHQLPPLFRLREDELPLSETDDDDSIKLRFKKFEKLVTSSYFEEMFINAGDALKSRLTEQYRMHPTIMNLINQFYPPDYQLTCGMINPDNERQHPYVLVGDNQVLTSKNTHTVWIDTSQRRVQNKLIDNFENKEEGKFNSRFNQYEVEVIRKILCSMNKQISGSENKNRDIAVISFYAGQVRKLKQMIDSLRQNGSVNNLNLRVGTVDQFQGMERPIVITSLVSSPEKKNGQRKPTTFVKEFRRINVAFSRAQSMLIVVGSVDVFNDVPVDVNFGYRKERKKPYKFLIETGKDRVNGSNYVRGYDINE